MTSNETIELEFKRHSAYRTKSQAQGIGIRLEMLTGKPTKTEEGTLKGQKVFWLLISTKSIRKQINQTLGDAIQ